MRHLLLHEHEPSLGPLDPCHGHERHARGSRPERRPVRPHWHARVRTTGLAIAAGLLAVSAHAEPQGNASLTIGGAGVGAEGTFWDHAEMHLGLRGDLMLGRSDAWDFGVGPYLELGTLAFDELQFGGGAEVLLPVNDFFPLILSGGMYGRVGDDDYGLEPGVCGGLFFGSRNYNFHANYVMVGGLLVGYRHSLGESQETALVIALQADLAFIGLPLVMLADLIRGPSPEAAAIEPLR